MGMIGGQGGLSRTSTDITSTDAATRDDIASPHLRQGTDGSLVWSDAPSQELLADRVAEVAVVMGIFDRLLDGPAESFSTDFYDQAVKLFRGVLPYTASMSYETLGQLADIAYGTKDGRVTDETCKDDDLVTMLVRSLSEYGVPSGMVARNSTLLPIVQEFEMREERARTDYDTPAPPEIAQYIAEITPELIGWTTSYRYAQDHRDALGILRFDEVCRPRGALLGAYPDDAKLALLQAALGHDSVSETTHSVSDRLPNKTNLRFIDYCRGQATRLSDPLFGVLNTIAWEAPIGRNFDTSDARLVSLASIADSLLNPNLQELPTSGLRIRSIAGQFALLGRPGVLGEWLTRASQDQVAQLWTDAIEGTRIPATGVWRHDVPTVEGLIGIYADAFASHETNKSVLVAGLARTPEFHVVVRDMRSAVSPLTPYITSLADVYLKNLPKDTSYGSRVEKLMVLAGDAIDNLHSMGATHVDTRGFTVVAAALETYLADKDLPRKEKRRIEHDPAIKTARSLIKAALSTRELLEKWTRIKRYESPFGIMPESRGTDQ